MATKSQKLGIPVHSTGIIATNENPDDYVGNRWIQPEVIAPEPVAPSGLIRRIAGDGILTAVKGAIGVPEAAVGLADIVTGGYAGKLAEEAGFRPKEARAMLDEYYTPEQKAAFSAVQNAANPEDGLGQRILDTGAAALRNPSTIIHAVGESLPLIGAGGVFGRGVMAVAQKAFPSVSTAMAAPLVASQSARTALSNAQIAAGGIGEGVMATGSGAEQMRQQTKDGYLTGEQSLLAAGSGALTGAIGIIAGKAAKSMGIGDIDTLLVGGAHVPQALQKGFTRKLLEGAFTEGVMEELPQSVQEQVTQNYALGKPLDEGVDQAVVMGLLSGGAMGMGAQMMSGRSKPAVPAVGPLSRGANMAGGTPAGAPAAPGGTPAAPITPVPAPLTPDQEQLLLDHANQRARELNDKAKGTKDQTMPGPDGKPMTLAGKQPEFLTTSDKAEQEFLNKAGGDVQALARAYPGLAAEVQAPEVAILPVNQADQTEQAPPTDPAEAARQQYRKEQAALEAQANQAEEDRINALIEQEKQQQADDNFWADNEPLEPLVKVLNNPKGEPFKTKGAAVAAQKREGSGEVVPVNGGFEVHVNPVQGETNVQDAAQGTKPQAAQAPGETPQAVAATPTSGLPAAGSVAVEGGGVAKNPWEMTQKDYVNHMNSSRYPSLKGGVEDASSAWKSMHKDRIEEAIADGKPVPDEVLADYPDLKNNTPATPTQSAPIGVTPQTESTNDQAPKALETSAQRPPQGSPAAVPAKPAEGTAIPATRQEGVATPGIPEVGQDEVGPLWSRMTTIEREAIAIRSGLQKVPAGNVSKRGWQGLDPVVRDRMQKVMDKDGQIAPTADQTKPVTPQLPPAAPQKVPVKQRIEEARQARADYFTPGNIVQGYSGHDRVISYKAPDGNGEGWNVTVQAVVKQDGKWVVDPKDNRVRTHSTMPEKGALSAGPVERVQQAAPEAAKPAEPDLRGQSFGNNLVMANGSVYRVEGVKDGKISLTRNPNQLNERPVAIDQDGYDKLVADAEETKAEILKSNAKPLSLDDQLKQVDDEIESQGIVKNARTRGVRDQLRKAIAERDYPAVLKAVDDNVDTAEAINQAEQFRGDEPIAKTIERVLKKRGITDEYRKRGTGRLMTAYGQNDELDAEMQGYEGKAGSKKTPEVTGPIANVLKAGIDSGKVIIKNIDDVPAPAKQEEAPKTDALKEKEKAAKAKMLNAAAKLAAMMGKNTRMNWTPEERQQILPIVIELFDGAMDLGAVSFQKAVRYVREFLASVIDQEAADAVPFKTLKGAYIAATDGRTEAGITTDADVAAFNSLEELENSAEKADTDEKDGQNDPRTEKQGSGALDGVPAAEVGSTAGRGPGGRGAKSGSTSRRKGNSSADGQGGTPGRSGGDGSAGTDTAATGGPGGGRGIAGNGGRIPADGGATNGKLASGSKRGAREGAPDLFTESGEVVPAAVPATNFTITPDLKLGSGGEVTKYKDNIAAIRALKLIESEHRRATAEEQRVLARYVGWGGLANVFRNRVTGAVNADWTNEVAELEALLTAKELKAASASTPNAHYTSETVTGFMWRAAERMGFKGGMVLEPSVGSGNFIGMMPESARQGSYVTAIELDGITARIASALYPQSNIVASGFEKLPLPADTFDLAIGNPPFGAISLRFQYNPKLNGKSIHNQFFLGSMEAVKPGGLQAMVVSRYLMDAQEKGARETLAIQSELLGAIRLPGSAFKGNAGTDVVTDILFLKKRTAEDQAALQFAFNERTAKVPAKEPAGDRADRLMRAAKLEAALEWTGTVKIADPLGGEAMVVSQYYGKNPKMVAGVMDRSGSMQFGGDIDVKLPASELAAKLDALMAFLPESTGVTASEEVDQRTQAMHKALGESLSIMASGREIGSIYYDESGALTEIVERVGDGGKTIVSKNTINASTPWSAQLSMNMEGKWFKEVAQLDEKGNKVKVGVKINLKTGKPTAGRNLWVREVFANEADIPNGLRLGAEGFAKLQKLVAIRELYVEQINLETNSAASEKMEGNRAKLRTAYEAFVSEHGYISEQKNATIVSEMPDEGLLLSLELKFRPAVSVVRAKAKGVKPSPASAQPNAILTRAVAIPPERKSNAASVSDAVAIVLGEAGRIDVKRVAELRSITEDEAMAELTEGDSPMAYLDPETNEVTEKNQYLSGNVRKKLIAAQDAGMKRNVEALMKVQPEPWTSDKVTAHMGASWVPPATYANFVQGLLGRNATVTFSKISNTFEVSAPGTSAVDTSKWGTGRYPAVELLNDILNSRRVAVYDGGGKDDPRVLNETETQSAIDKKKEIIEEFDNWIFKDGDRRQELVRLFNDLYNTRVNRQYDGAHMDFPGKVPDSIIAFRRNQINAIWRGIVERFTMYDHAVGAGKTFTGISRAMERKRMGLSNKPAIVVPNHLVAEWSTQAYRLYPGAKILAAGVKDLTPKNRRRLFAKIAAGDWDLVIIPHSSFKFIGISPETEERFINDELRVAQEALKEAEDDAEPGQRFKPLSVKAAEALILKLENRMDVVRGKAGKDQLLTFEQMGIDDLTVDESHEFKNLTYSTKLTDVRGLGPAAGSQKAFDLYTKMRILHETNGSAVFLTGTPISNSAVEMYTIMRYLAPDVLKENGLEHFDAFRAQFVQASEKPEPTEAGDGLKVVNRLGRNWSNMRSLMDGYYSVADVVTNDDIKAWYAEDNPGEVFPLPNVKGGGRRTVVAKPTPTQQLLIDELIAGYNNLPNIEDVKERNIARLQLMDKARKLALHAKVWDRNLTDEPGGKLDKVVEESMRIYKAFEAKKGTQLIFLDRSVPKSKGDDKVIKEYDALRAKLTQATTEGDEKGQREAIEALEKFDPQEIDELRAAQAGGWNAYQHMADGLMAQGVPREQIAFIQNYNTDADKKALFEAVNDGTIRFLFGSSARMGAGMNVQERLVGLHHVDVTWKPSDIEQREGRIIRQGNLFATPRVDGKHNPLYDPAFEVEIMAYVTERSIDAKMWDLNSTKLRMVNGIRYYDGEFEMDFDDDAAIDMAEIAAIASGDPLMLERIKVNTVIEELYRKRRSYNRRVEAAGDALRRAERDASDLPDAMEKMKALAEPIGKAIQEAEKDQRERTIRVGEKDYSNLQWALNHAEQQIFILKEGDSKKPFSLNIDGKSYTSEAGVQDAITEKLGDIDAFLAEVAGEKVIRRTAVARELRRVIGNEFTEVPTTTIGSLYGFQLTMSSENGMFGNANVYLAVKVPYAGGVESVTTGYGITPEKHKKGTPVPVLTSTLRVVVGQLTEKLNSKANIHYELQDMQRQIDRAKENIPTYQEAAKEQFKQADELDAALTRLDDIQDQLQARAAAASAPVAAPTAQDDDTPAFSRGNIATGLTAPQVNSIVSAITERWGNAPDIVIAASMEDAQIPQSVRDYDKKQKSLGAKGNPEGFVHGGKVYLLADQLATPTEVMRVLFHESLGHMGLRGVFGDKLDGILKQLAGLRRSDVAAKAEQYGLDMNVEADRLHAAEEVLAELAQAKPELGYVKRAIGLIRGWLRANVPGLGGMKLSDSDIIAQFIIPARRFVQGGNGPKGGKKAEQTGNIATPGVDQGATEPSFSRSLGASLTAGLNNVRDVKLAAGYQVSDLFRGEGRLSYWHKSVGTMYNLAQRDKSFKRVFDSVQNFLNDSSFYAAESADLAPRILPKLDKIGDVFKSPLSPEDTKALSAPVFEGTLTWGRDSAGKAVPMEEIEKALAILPLDDRAHKLVKERKLDPKVLKMWQGLQQDQYEAIINGKFEREFMRAGAVFTPAELKKHFNLTDAQIGLYQEFRAATDKSIDNLAISEMLKYAGDDVAPLRDQIIGMDDVEEAGQVLRDYLVALTDGESSSTFDADKVVKANIEAENLRKEADEIEANAGNRSSKKVADLEQKIDAEEDKAVALGKEGKLTEADAVMKGVKALEDKLISAKRSANGQGYAIAAGKRAQADSLMENALESTEGQTKRYGVLIATAAKMLDIAAHAKDMKDRGYAPLLRFGNFTLEATLSTGERYFSLFETDRERNKMLRMLTAEGAEDVQAGTMSQESYKLLNGISPETAALFGEMLGLDSQGSEAKDLAFQEFIKRGTANRSAMKRLLKRKGIAGFSEDSGRVLAGFIYSNARRTSSNLHSKETTSAVDAIPKQKGELKDVAVKLQEYVSVPQEEAQAFRGILFAQYLGGSIASAIVNASQPFTVTLPYLSQFGGIRKAAAQMASATKLAARMEAGLTNTTGNVQLDAALKKAEEEGIVSPQEVHALQAQAAGKAQLQSGDGTTMGNALATASNGLSKLSLAWGKVFGVAEQFNRRTTFIAAYRTAVEQGNANPAAFAEKAVSETQFVYNKANKPRWARGTAGSILFTFKQYSVNYLELVARMATAGKPGSPERQAGQKAALLAIAILFMMAGADGLPFAEDIQDVLDGIMQRLGYNISTKQAVKSFLANQLGKDGAAFVMNGVSGVPGIPIDVSGRLGMGNLIPGTGLAQKKVDHTRDLAELAGPGDDFVKRAFNATEQALTGDVVKAMGTISPVASRNAIKAIDMTGTGMYRDDGGRKVIETTGTEAFLKGIGFQPRNVKEVQDASREVQRSTAQYILASGEIRQKMAQAIFANDNDLKQAARDDVTDWNTNNPSQKMTLNMPAVLRRVHEMRKSKEQRMADTAPKAIRAQVREQLKAGLH